MSQEHIKQINRLSVFSAIHRWYETMGTPPTREEMQAELPNMAATTLNLHIRGLEGATGLPSPHIRRLYRVNYNDVPRSVDAEMEALL